MKNFFRISSFLLFLFLSTNLMADLEHVPGQGEEIPMTKILKQRSCFRAIQALGCVHPKEDQVLFRTCLDQKREKLGQSCKEFFERLYGREVDQN